MNTSSAAQHSALRIIRGEHDRLSAVIQGMVYFVRTIDRSEKAPDLKVFRAMLLYVSEFADRMHHPKEDQHLFACLRKRTNEVDGTLTELERQHSLGDSLVRGLEHALVRYELEGAAAFPVFRDLVDEYAAFYFNHMRLEENLIFPAARRYLSDQDWVAIDMAFSANCDPLAGAALGKNFEKLFSLIVQIAPAPIGLASAALSKVKRTDM